MNEAAVIPSFLKSLLPRTAKRVAKEAWTKRQFRRALQKLADLPPGQTPTAALLAELRLAWANDAYSGRIDYLMEMARRAVSTPGPILECGSGLSTILVGLLAARRGIDVWSLEHIPDWHARVGSVLEYLGISTVHLHLAPLRSYGDLDWYSPPLASMPHAFRLVICDGPPGTTRGGRYGLLPVMRARLPKSSLVLLDDAGRPEEQNMIQRWAAEAGWSATLQGPDDPCSRFAIISV